MILLQGVWVHPEIDNPEYTSDPNLYKRDEVCAIGFDLWQVKSGTIFDSIMITDDIQAAKDFGENVWKKTYVSIRNGSIRRILKSSFKEISNNCSQEGEKKMKEAQDEEERKESEQKKTDDEDEDEEDESESKPVDETSEDEVRTL